MANEESINDLPDELWLNVFKCFHPVYDDIFTLSLVCKQWREMIISHPDPSLWEVIEISNTRHCYLDSPYIARFTYILKNYARFVKVIKLRRSNGYFSDVLSRYTKRLWSLQVLEISGMNWDKKILHQLPCCKTLRSIKIEAACEGQGSSFDKRDLAILIDNFPGLENVSLLYSIVNEPSLNKIQDITASCCGQRITELHLERAKVESFELSEIIQNLPGLQRLSFGNDQIHGLPSIQELQLMSKSIRELRLFQIGDYAEFSFNLPTLHKLCISFASSLKKLTVYAPSLRILNLNHCSELRKVSKVTCHSLDELTVRKCSSLNWPDLIRFLVRNPDIKSLKLEVSVVNLRLDQHCNPSLEKLQVLDSSTNLTCLDVRCPKLKVFKFKKSLMQPSMVKVIAIKSDELDEISIKDVPHLRKVILNVQQIKFLELDFDRRLHQVKPHHFSSIHFQPNSTVYKFVLKKLNLRSMTTNACEVTDVVVDACNLDIPLCEVLEQFHGLQYLTLQKSYGTCQIVVQNDTLRELRVNSCLSVMMDNIMVVCPALEKFHVHGSTILPTKKELEITAYELKRISPHLLAVNFSH